MNKRECATCEVREAVEIVWCPTWINLDNRSVPECQPRKPFMGCPVKGRVTDRPPRHVCSECARVFKPAFNEHAVGGTFYWGDEAIQEFKIQSALN